MCQVVTKYTGNVYTEDLDTDLVHFTLALNEKVMKGVNRNGIYLCKVSSIPAKSNAVLSLSHLVIGLGLYIWVILCVCTGCLFIFFFISHNIFLL